MKPTPHSDTQINRLASGGRIHRDERIHFWYDGKKYAGHRGDTLASALLANGVVVVGRSFKYHRPRGVFSAGAEEPNALVQLESGGHTEPNRRATEIEIYPGLRARSQNCWPSAAFDLGAISARLWRLLPAGFYYKTFMWPRAWWMTYEKFIRRAAGLGRAPTAPDPDCYDKLHAHCDVLIVGGGGAGLQAACAAAASGARIILADEKSEFGGALLAERHAIDRQSSMSIERQSPMDWVAQRVATLSKMPHVTLLPRTTVTGYYDYNFLVAEQRVSEHLGPAQHADSPKAPKARLWKIRAKQVVLCTGSIERPLVFADCDRPGVMLAGAVRAYINRFGVLPGRRVVTVTNNDSAYLAAMEAKRAADSIDSMTKNAGGAANLGDSGDSGDSNVAIVDVRPAADGELAAQARALGIAIYANSTLSAVRYRRGKITQVTVMELSADGTEAVGEARHLPCDIIAVSGGWTPTVHLFSQAKVPLQYSEKVHAFLPTDCDAQAANQLRGAGACCGAQSLAECLAQGDQAGKTAATAAGFTNAALDANAAAADKWQTVEPRLSPMRALWVLPCDHPIGRGAKKHFHELANDSTLADLALAQREGFTSPEHLKRYTTTGMGTDQGKTSNLNALAALAANQGTTIQALGATTFRPPYTPLTFGSIVGLDRRELFLQKRTTPMHPWHAQRGAVFEDVGDWKRPFYFPLAGEDMAAALRRECLAARTTIGIVDASTLGKIDLRGKDAIALLNMVYTNAWNKLAPGRCRYGLMLNEHGMVFDDGVTTCLAENHYHMTTTTGGAARVATWLEEWLQTEWPSSEVYCTSVTEQWAVASISGPKCRELLADLCDAQLDAEAFPFMSMRRFAVAGIPARVFRISFTGELAYEINVPARFGLALWQALMAGGEKYGICPYGTEAMHILRAEKGFIIAGQDTDGTTTPGDLGMDWIVSKSKADFAGQRSLARPDTARAGRKQLVGLLSKDPKFVLPEGAHVVESVRKSPPMKMLGHVSSSYMSPNVGRSIALALLQDGFARRGETVHIPLMDGSRHRAVIVDSVFLDPHGERANG